MNSTQNAGLFSGFVWSFYDFYAGKDLFCRRKKSSVCFLDMLLHKNNIYYELSYAEVFV